MRENGIFIRNKELERKSTITFNTKVEYNCQITQKKLVEEIEKYTTPFLKLCERKTKKGIGDARYFKELVERSILSKGF